MTLRRKTWIAALTAAALALASAPSFAALEPSLAHPSDMNLTTPSHSPADLDLTRRIRDALVASDKVTSLGRNVAIEARDGEVTLKGTVTNLSERTLVGDIASRIAGRGKVENELEFIYVM